MARRIILITTDFHDGAAQQLRYIGSEGWTSSPSDTLANTHFEGRLKRDGDPTYERGVTCLLWNKGAGSATPISDFEINNTDGFCDAWLPYRIRDRDITIRLGTEGQAYSAFVIVAQSVGEVLEVKDEHTLREVLKDKSAKLDKPLQSSLYPSSVPNTDLEGNPRPITLGTCKWVPLITQDAPNLEYDLTDGPFSGVDELRDQGVVITLGTGWALDRATDVFGVLRLTNPAGKQVATTKGAIKLGTAIIDGSTGGGDFTAWTGGIPDGWTEVSAGDGVNDIDEATADQARFVSSGASSIRLTRTAVMTIGALYFCEFDVTAYTSGTLQISDRVGATTGTVHCTATAAGHYAFAFVPSAADLGVRNSNLTACNFRIDNFRLYPATYIERLPDWITYLAVTRGGLVAGDLDTAGTITALDTAAPYELNFHTAQNVRITDVLKATMDSFTGWFFFDRLGVMKVGRLVAPSGTAVIELTDIELVGDVTVEPDLAPGLSDTWAGVRNYGVHSEGEIAGSIYGTGAGRTDAWLLKSEYLVKRKGTGVLHAAYAHAVGAEPIKTLLTNTADIQAEANRVTALYTVERKFYKFTAMLAESYTLEPGDTVKVTTDRFDLTAGKFLLVIYAKSRFLSDRVEITAWG